jgi:hypothetical protein
VHHGHHRDPAFRNRREQGEQIEAVTDVEVGRRLVEQEQLRLLGEGAGDERALPLARAEQ